MPNAPSQNPSGKPKAMGLTPAETLGSPIMVVEDDPLAATFISVLIQKAMSLQIDWICDSASAVRVIRRAAADQGGKLPRAIICDMHIGDEVSEALLQWIRTSAVTVGMPVLGLSADDTRAMRQRALDAGATSFISKSKVITELVPWLKNHMLSEEQAAEMQATGGRNMEPPEDKSGPAEDKETEAPAPADDPASKVEAA